MDNKYIVGIVGVVVAIILVGSLLTPVINDLSEGETEQTEKEGAYGTLIYQGTPEDYTTYPYRYFQTNLNDTTLSVKTGYANALAEVATIDTAQLDKPLIVYADNNVTIYIDNGQFHFSSETVSEVNGVTANLNTQPYVAYSSNRGMTYGTGSSNTYVTEKITYYYQYNNGGDYANFEGSNPPAMDTPAVSVDGVYIGEKYTTITKDSPYASLYGAIVVIVLASILIASVGYFITMKRE